MNKVISIFGPTTTSKTKLALDLSRFVFGRFQTNSELISADSRKIYIEMKIGQSKIVKNENRIPIHMMNILSLDKEYTLYQYKNEVDRVIDKIHLKNHLPIIFGGTGTYILSVIENWNIPKDCKAEDNYKDYGKSENKYDVLFLSLKYDVDQIYSMIDLNVEKMFQKGLFEEFLSLAEKYMIPAGKKQKKFNILKETLAYREFIDHTIQNKVSDFNMLNKGDLEKIKYKIKKNIKDYARHQIGWYKKMKNVILVEDFDEAKKEVEKFL